MNFELYFTKRAFIIREQVVSPYDKFVTIY